MASHVRQLAWNTRLWPWEDRGPLPEVSELQGDAAWEEFLLCSEDCDARLRPPAGRGGSTGILRVDDVMRLAAMRGRVCPIPGAWKRLYLLLHSARKPSQDRTPMPLSPSEWSRTTDLQKRLRLRELAMWAQRHGALQAVHSYLCALAERDSHHLDIGRWPELRAA